MLINILLILFIVFGLGIPNVNAKMIESVFSDTGSMALKTDNYRVAVQLVLSEALHSKDKAVSPINKVGLNTLVALLLVVRADENVPHVDLSYDVRPELPNGTMLPASNLPLGKGSLVKGGYYIMEGQPFQVVATGPTDTGVHKFHIDILDSKRKVASGTIALEITE